MPQDSAIYGVARIRCHEKDLLAQDRLSRLADASADEAIRQLVDAGYGSMPDATIEDADRLIESELNNAYELVREVTFKPTVTDVFLMKADVHNLKMLLKLRLTGGKEKPALMKGGCYSVETLTDMVLNANYRELPPEFKTALEKLEQGFQSVVDPVAVSVALDRAYTEYAYRVGDAFTKEYFKIQADFNNVLSLLRLRAMNAGVDKLRAVLLPEGYIPQSKLLANMDAPLDSLGKTVGTGPAREGIIRGIDAMMKTGNISALEKERDNTLISLAGKDRMECETIAPVIGYLLAREQEAKCIRLILTAKRNGLDDAIITERLRELYG